MKAAYYANYGPADVLEIRDVTRPEISDDEILIKVFSSAVTTADWRIRASAFPSFAWVPGRLMFGLLAPRNKVLGTDFAGRIVAKGKNVTGFKGGDRVFGFAGQGSNAEYVKIAANGPVAQIPSNLSYNDAAAVPFGALSALVFLRDFAKVQPGQSVLINGASGGVGVFAVQLAKYFGAHVTGVASTGNLGLVSALGADEVIDYTTTDFTAQGDKYDLVFDTVGKTTFSSVRSVLSPTGIYLPIEFGLREIFQSLMTSRSKKQRVMVGVSDDKQSDIKLVSHLLEQGKIRPVIDALYSLDDIADAHRRVESRHKTGSTIVVVSSDDESKIAAA